MASLKHRSQFYHNLATLENAGLPRLRALQQPFPVPFNRAAKRMADDISGNGLTVSEAMERHRDLFSPLEISLVRVGELTGTLETSYRSLARWFDTVRNLRSTVISGLLYPILVYHVAAVIIPAIGLFTGKASAQAVQARILMLTAAPWLLLLAWRIASTAPVLAGILGGILDAIPLVGGIRHKLDYARFFRAYSLGLGSGLGTIASCELAAGACAGPARQRRFLRCAKAIASEGCTFGEAFAANAPRAERNGLAMQLMITGEQTGTPSESAARVADIYHDDATVLLTRMARIVPTLMYLAMALYIAFQIIRLYSEILIGPMQELL